MSDVLGRVLGREAEGPVTVLNRPSRWRWGPERRRVVKVAVVRDEQGVLTASVYGVGADGAVEELQREVASSLQRGRAGSPMVLLASGDSWALQSIGCGCNLPHALAGFNPLVAEYRPLT